MKYVTFVLAIFALFVVCAITSAKEPSQRDQLHIAVQEICPVSGEKLGEHGTPLKVKMPAIFASTKLA